MSADIKNENKAYTYTLFASGKGSDSVDVTGRLPREWLVSTGSTWEGNASGDTVSEMAGNFGGNLGRAGQVATTVGGSNVGFTALSNRQWTGGMPLTWNLLAEYTAYANALEDVMRPVLLLQSMSMPTALGNPAIPLPGGGEASLGNIIGAPYWKDAASSGAVGGMSQILLRLGNMFVFDDIIVETVNITYPTQLASPGIPIKAVAEIQVATRGPITFEQYVGYMTGSAVSELFSAGDRIQAAREAGPGQRAGYSDLKPVPPTR